MEQELKTHYYFFSHEEGDGFEVYFCDYPQIRGVGDTYDDAYREALEAMQHYREKQKDDDERERDNAGFNDAKRAAKRF